MPRDKIEVTVKWKDAFNLKIKNCVSHEQVFGKALAHEFYITYCHTVRNLIAPHYLLPYCTELNCSTLPIAILYGT